MAKKQSDILSLVYFSSITLYNKGDTYNILSCAIYEFKAYNLRGGWRSTKYTHRKVNQMYHCKVFAENIYEAYMALLDLGYEDIVIINP